MKTFLISLWVQSYGYRKLCMYICISIQVEMVGKELLWLLLALYLDPVLLARESRIVQVRQGRLQGIIIGIFYELE